MAKVPNGVETLPKISNAWVGRTKVRDDKQTNRRQTTDRRQTDGRRHIANVNVSSRSLKIDMTSQLRRTLLYNAHTNVQVGRQPISSWLTAFLPRCMQTRSCDENSVRLFVRPPVGQTRGLWQNGRKICIDFYRAAWNADAVLRWEFCLSVRPSVRLSNACIVTKRKKAMFRFLYHTKEQ